MRMLLVIAVLATACAPAPNNAVGGHPPEMTSGALAVAFKGEFESIRIYRVCDGDITCFYVADGRSGTTTAQWHGSSRHRRYMPVFVAKGAR